LPATAEPVDPAVFQAEPVQSAGFRCAHRRGGAAGHARAAGFHFGSHAAPTPVSPAPAIPATPNATLPRAGFWIRAGAILIDVILVGMICGPMGVGELILPGLAAYGAVMWKFKGATIGGIVCGLRVVRLDDRPLDRPTTVVRALGCFLSLAVAGLRVCLGGLRSRASIAA